MQPLEKPASFSGFATDERLTWALFKQGNLAAYEYFYAAYSDFLFRYGCKILADREQVKDCMHDLFTEIWTNRAGLGAPESVKNYLAKALRNKLIRQAIKQGKFAGEDELLSGRHHTQTGSPELNLIDRETSLENQRRLICALKKLTNKQKEIIFLLYYNDMSPAEVASILSISVRTVYNGTFEAIQSLKAELVIPLLYILILYLF